MMKNVKIRTRLIVSYLIIVAFLVVSGVVSIVMLNSVGNNLQSFYDNQFQTVDSALNARRLVFSIRADVFNALLTDDAAGTQESVSSAKADFAEIKTYVSKLHDTFQGEAALLTQVDSWLTEAEPHLNQICTMALSNQNSEAFTYLGENYKPLMDQVRTNLTEVGEIADTNAHAKVESGMALATTADIIIIAIIIVAVILSVIIALFMAEGIRKPVNEMMRVSEELVKGNMNVDITYESKDELGELAGNLRGLTTAVKNIISDVHYCFGELAGGNFTVDSRAKQSYVGDYRGILDGFTNLRDSMNDTLTQIDVSADQVNSGGEQVSSGAQALAQGATEQAASVQELAATINSISEQVKTTAELAGQAEEDDRRAGDEIQQCSAHMNDLMSAMQVISDKSKEISKVVKTIEDIAFQTNILALNAAVEAARAGSAGKGFAVVADEVRNLATKSQEAAKSTTTLIEETVRAVENGSQLSVETDKALQAVVADAEKVLTAVTNISGATAEQSDAVAQVTTGIDQISSVVQTNSATAEQSAAASEELSAQAKLLKDLVSKFTLSADGGHRPMAASSHSGGDSDYGAHSFSGGDKY